MQHYVAMAGVLASALVGVQTGSAPARELSERRPQCSVDAESAFGVTTETNDASRLP